LGHKEAQECCSYAPYPHNKSFNIQTAKNWPLAKFHQSEPRSFAFCLMMAFSCRLSPLKDHPNCQIQAARHGPNRVVGALESADYQNASAVRSHHRQQPCKLVPAISTKSSWIIVLFGGLWPSYKTSEMFFCVTAFSRFTQLFSAPRFTCRWHFVVSQRVKEEWLLRLFCFSEKLPEQSTSHTAGGGPSISDNSLTEATHVNRKVCHQRPNRNVSPMKL
jgi:hypothetical protein